MWHHTGKAREIVAYILYLLLHTYVERIFLSCVLGVSSQFSLRASEGDAIIVACDDCSKFIMTRFGESVAVEGSALHSLFANFRSLYFDSTFQRPSSFSNVNTTILHYHFTHTPSSSPLYCSSEPARRIGPKIAPLSVPRIVVVGRRYGDGGIFLTSHLVTRIR